MAVELEGQKDIEVVEQFRERKAQILREIRKIIVGQERIIEEILISVFARGHCLIIGVPGLAKTLIIKTVAQVFDLTFSRIQFTPDLMPSDIIGTEFIEDFSVSKKMKFIKGPIFANIVLADEINRTPPKTQSALLEVMQENQITVAGTTYVVDKPFFVLATQNPIEQEGTYPLPEAQVDRFMLKLSVTYPDKEEEMEIQNRMTIGQTYEVNRVISPEDILKARKVVHEVYIDQKVKEYIVNIVMATRNPDEYGLDLKDLIAYGASPRATIYLNLAGKAHAFLRGRGYVTPEDIKSIGMDVLRHRIIVTYEAEAEEITSENIVRQVFDHIEVP